jgi:acyl-coenzyme A thioesterase PaaI-like protein
MVDRAPSVAEMADRKHVLSELGLAVELRGDELRGHARITPLMHVPGTDVLRTSILAAWTDTVTGLLCTGIVSPKIPVTLDLTLELHRVPHAVSEVTLVGRIIKTSKSAMIAEADIDADGEPLAISTATFMTAPDPGRALPALPSLEQLIGLLNEPREALTVPFAERAGCDRGAPGTAALRRTEEGTNASNTISGGLLALVAEEAALSATPGSTLTSLALRYLRPSRVGPVVAVARVHGDLSRVEVRDTGKDDRLVVLATSRSAPAAV